MSSVYRFSSVAFHSLCFPPSRVFFFYINYSLLLFLPFARFLLFSFSFPSALYLSLSLSLYLPLSRPVFSRSLVRSFFRPLLLFALSCPRVFFLPLSLAFSLSPFQTFPLCLCRSFHISRSCTFSSARALPFLVRSHSFSFILRHFLSVGRTSFPAHCFLPFFLFVFCFLNSLSHARSLSPPNSHHHSPPSQVHTHSHSHRLTYAHCCFCV